MNAEILPYVRKYYGTDVGIWTSTRGEPDYVIPIWITDDSGMSERELEMARRSMDMPNATKEEIEAEGWICDSHYETVTAYKVAELIVNAINEGKV
jgi:hypothetical protein